MALLPSNSMLELLNHYANLLSVVVTLLLLGLTAAYVLLTWRNLKAFERASFHEHRLRHLQDIKQNVARPVVAWLADRVIPALKGHMTEKIVIVRSVPIRRSRPEIGQPSYDYGRQLGPAILIPETLASDLFNDARENHFGRRLAKLEEFNRKLETLIADLVAFARACADDIAAKTSLPRTSSFSTVADFADADYFVQSCLRDLIGGEHPNFATTRASTSALEIADRYATNDVVARGPSAPLLAWVNESATYMAEKWANSPIQEALAYQLRDAKEVVQSIGAIDLTYSLPGDCDYVGSAS
ncbi:MAG: hypothetical protein ACJ71Q_03425 [Terriglobales bacterium]